MTYSEILNEFEQVTGLIPDDYRPCCELHDVPNINNAIVVWLKGYKFVYVANENREEIKTELLRWMQDQKDQTKSMEEKFWKAKEHDKAQEQKCFAMCFDYVMAAVNNPAEYGLEI